MIQSTPRKTLPDLISDRVEMSFSQMVTLRKGNFSTTSLIFFSSFEFLPSRVGGGPYIPNKSDHIEGRWVVGVPEKFHESMYNASCDFRKFDGSDVDRLNKELAVF